LWSGLRRNELNTCAKFSLKGVAYFQGPDSVMRLSVVIRTECCDIDDEVWTALRQRNNVMGFEKHAAIRQREALLAAELTVPGRAS